LEEKKKKQQKLVIPKEEWEEKERGLANEGDGGRGRKDLIGRGGEKRFFLFLLKRVARPSQRGTFFRRTASSGRFHAGLSLPELRKGEKEHREKGEESREVIERKLGRSGGGERNRTQGKGPVFGLQEGGEVMTGGKV